MTKEVCALENLQTLFEFTEADLQANREGRLSEAQLARNWAEVEETCVNIVAAGPLIPLLLLSIAGYFYVAVGYGDALGPWVCATVFVWLFGTYGVMYGLFKLLGAVLRRMVPLPRHTTWLCRVARRVQPLGFDALDKGIVEVHSGLLTVESDGEHEYLLLDGQEFTISVAAEQDERLWKLEPDRRYAIYTVPDVHWVVAVEELTDEDQT